MNSLKLQPCPTRTRLDPFAGEGTERSGQEETSQRMQSISVPYPCKMKRKPSLREGKGLPQGHPASDRVRCRAWALTPTQALGGSCTVEFLSKTLLGSFPATCCCWLAHPGALRSGSLVLPRPSANTLVTGNPSAFQLS